MSAKPANGNGRVAWLQVILTAAAVLVGVTGGMWALAIAPIKGELTRIELVAREGKDVALENKSNIDRMMGENATSIKDRENLNKVKDTTVGEIAGVQSDLKVISAKLTEVETQFRAVDQSKNIQWANTLRWLSVIYEKAFPGSRFPSQIQYYPEIAQPPTK